MTVALTTADIAVVGPPPHPPIRVTSLATVYLGGPHNAYRQVTTVCMHVLGEQPVRQRNMTTINYTILATRTPLYRFTNVILPDVFPYDISYNSVGSTRFATDVIVVDSGDDQRTQRWDQPLMEYDIAYGVRTMEQLHALISFFRAMRGRLYAFNYKDPVDHSSTLAMATEARSPPPPTPFDQQIGSGDGAELPVPTVEDLPDPLGARQSGQVDHPAGPGLGARRGERRGNLDLDRGRRHGHRDAAVRPLRSPSGTRSRRRPWATAATRPSAASQAISTR